MAWVSRNRHLAPLHSVHSTWNVGAVAQGLNGVRRPMGHSNEAEFVEFLKAFLEEGERWACEIVTAD